MPFPDYTSLPQYANILHLWKLEEESGTRVDAKGDCDLSDNNTVLYGNGKIGNGADFELDNSEYLSATSGASSDMNFTSGNFSVSVQWKPETLAGVNKFFLNRGSGNADGWYFFYNPTTDEIRIMLHTSGAHTTVYSKTGLFTAGTLYHLVIVRDGTTGYVYVNKVDETSTSDTLVDAVSSGRSFYVGCDDANAQLADGLMDEIIVWNVALSSAEVTTLYDWYSKVGLSGAVSFTGDLNRKLSLKRILEGEISFIGILTHSRLYKKLLEGGISFIGELSRKVARKRTLEGAFSSVNLNQNPSIEVDTSGYSALSGVTISRDTIEHYIGIASLKCVTDNVYMYEGWERNITSESEAGKEYIFSLYLKGSGTVRITFYDNATGDRHGSVITLTSTWTRYSMTATFGAGSTTRVLEVRTNTQQDITFYSDAIMHTEGSTLFPFSTGIIYLLTGTLQRKLSLKRLLEGDLSFIGILTHSRLYKKLLEGGLSFIGTLSRKLSLKRTLEGELSFIGSLIVRKLWSKLARAVASMTKLVRGSASMTKESRDAPSWTKEDREKEV